MAQKNEVKKALEKIRFENVKKMEIIHYPLDILTRIGISPDWLEARYSYKLTIKNEGIPYYLPSLVWALENTEIVKRKEKGGDMRWGVLLFDAEDRRTASIYADKFGSMGYINSIPVDFKGEIVDGLSDNRLSWWLMSHFRGVFMQGDDLFVADAFSGHAIFVWEESSDYAFAWLPNKDSFIQREDVLEGAKRGIREYLVIERMKKMKGLKKIIPLFLIKRPDSPDFMDINSSPMVSKEDFSDLILRLEAVAQASEIDLRIYSDEHSKRFIGRGF